MVVGSGGLAAWARGDDREFQRWAAVGLTSDGADLVLGLRSRPLVGTKSALIATFAPVPFIGAAVLGFVLPRRAADEPVTTAKRGTRWGALLSCALIQ